jgi:hypothetical protein
MKIIISIMSAQFKNFKSKNRRNSGYIALETGKTYYISGKTKYIPENENKSSPWKCCRIKIIV